MEPYAGFWFMAEEGPGELGIIDQDNPKFLTQNPSPLVSLRITYILATEFKIMEPARALNRFAILHHMLRHKMDEIRQEYLLIRRIRPHSPWLIITSWSRQQLTP